MLEVGRDKAVSQESERVVDSALRIVVLPHWSKLIGSLNPDRRSFLIHVAGTEVDKNTFGTATIGGAYTIFDRRVCVKTRRGSMSRR